MALEYPLLTSEQQRKLRSLGVLVVYLFGSQAEERSHAISDLDLGVVLHPKHANEENLNGLYQALYDLFTDVFTDRSVDIVFLQRAGLEIAVDAITHGQVLFETSTGERLEFEERLILLYADFRPLLDQLDSAALDRLQQ